MAQVRARGLDTEQQGGDFPVDANGVIRYARAGRYSDDRPPVGELIDALKRIAPRR